MNCMIYYGAGIPRENAEYVARNIYGTFTPKEKEVYGQPELDYAKFYRFLLKEKYPMASFEEIDENGYFVFMEKDSYTYLEGSEESEFSFNTKEKKKEFKTFAKELNLINDESKKEFKNFVKELGLEGKPGYFFKNYE